MKPDKDFLRLLTHMIPAPISTVMKNKKEKRKTKFDYHKEMKHY